MHGLQPPSAFPAALRHIGKRPLLVCYNDADGLSAGVILKKVLRHAGRDPHVRIIGRGENAYSDAFQAEIELRKATHKITGLVLTDVGTSSRLANILPSVIVDHHVPTGMPEWATVISGIEDVPIPTSSLLAYRCALSLYDATPLLWLAALGIIGTWRRKTVFRRWKPPVRTG